MQFWRTWFKISLFSRKAIFGNPQYISLIIFNSHDASSFKHSFPVPHGSCSSALQREGSVKEIIEDTNRNRNNLDLYYSL